jgi:hypothetical protein
MSVNGKKYSAEIAAQEHLLAGKRLTRLEAIVLFGVTNLTSLIRRLRDKGWIVGSRRITYLAALKRMEPFARVEPPSNLPVRDLRLTEYWINR